MDCTLDARWFPFRWSNFFGLDAKKPCSARLCKWDEELSLLRRSTSCEDAPT